MTTECERLSTMRWLWRMTKQRTDDIRQQRAAVLRLGDGDDQVLDDDDGKANQDLTLDKRMA